jgi:hypothetical protein
VRAEFKTVLAGILGQDSSVSLLIANSVWSRIPIKPSFMSAMKAFDAEALPLKEVEEVNAWVAVRERDRERQRETERDRDRETERDRERLCLC